MIKLIACSFKLVSWFLSIKLNGGVKELVLYSNKMDYLGLLVSWKEYWTDLGTGHYLSPEGGGGDYFGLNKVKFSRSPHLNVTSLKWSHLKTFVHFRDPPPPPPPPHVFIFQANLTGLPSESFQSFQRSPFLGSQLWLIPPFALLKMKWCPLKSSDPSPPAINNDRSLSAKWNSLILGLINWTRQNFQNVRTKEPRETFVKIDLSTIIF